MGDMSIGDAARASGVKVTTIRFYEDRGLLPSPPRSPSGRRMYDARLVARLTFIKHGRALGFDLDDIETLLGLADHPDQDCGAADSIARRQLASVTARIAQLQALAEELDRMVRHCHGGPMSHCTVIESLADHGKCSHKRHDLPQ